MELQELLQSYLIKLNSLKDLVDIKPALEDEEDVLVNNYALLAKESVCLASLCKEFQEEKLRTESVTGDIQGLHSEIRDMNKEIKTLSEKVPKYLPGKNDVIEECEQAPAASEGKENKPTNSKGRAKSATSKAGSKSATTSTKTGKGSRSPPPQLTYIMANEFNGVPKYMKGRILYSEANKAVDILNQAATEKYKIVCKSKALNDFQRRKKIEYMEQESKDTEGKYFVTDEDIKEYTSTKIDKHFLSLMTILRHCGRVKQLRAGKVTKHVLTAG